MASSLFKGLEVCSTGFKGAEKNAVKRAVEEGGGTYNGKFTEKATHLVASVRSGAKCAAATVLGTPIVSVQWVVQSAAALTLLATDDFAMNPPPALLSTVAMDVERSCRVVVSGNDATVVASLLRSIEGADVELGDVLTQWGWPAARTHELLRKLAAYRDGDGDARPHSSWLAPIRFAELALHRWSLRHRNGGTVQRVDISRHPRAAPYSSSEEDASAALKVLSATL
jgi:hypothetical protein